MFALLLLGGFAHGNDPMTIERLRQDFTKIVAHLDYDHDGRVSRNEWYNAPELAVPGAMAPLSASDRIEKKLFAIGDFKNEDTNQDKFVTVDELVASREPIFRCLDANGDGMVTSVESAASKNKCMSAKKYR